MGKIPGSSKIAKPNQINHLSIQHVGYVKPELDNNESVDNCNALTIAKDLNSYDALGFQVLSRAENVTEVLVKQKILYSVEESSQNVDIPWINCSSAMSEELHKNSQSKHLVRYKDLKSVNNNPVIQGQCKAIPDTIIEGPKVLPLIWNVFTWLLIVFCCLFAGK